MLLNLSTSLVFLESCTDLATGIVTVFGRNSTLNAGGRRLQVSSTPRPKAGISFNLRAYISPSPATFEAAKAVLSSPAAISAASAPAMKVVAAVANIPESALSASVDTSSIVKYGDPPAPAAGLDLALVVGAASGAFAAILLLAGAVIVVQRRSRGASDLHKLPRAAKTPVPLLSSSSAAEIGQRINVVRVVGRNKAIFVPISQSSSSKQSVAVVNADGTFGAANPMMRRSVLDAPPPPRVKSVLDAPPPPSRKSVIDAPPPPKQKEANERLAEKRVEDPLTVRDVEIDGEPTRAVTTQSRRPASAEVQEHLGMGALDTVVASLRANGLRSSQLVVAVDLSAANLDRGARSFDGRSLHDVSASSPTPYQSVISAVGRTLAPFDSDGLIPLYGCLGKAVIPLHVAGGVSAPGSDDPANFCRGFEEVLSAYTQRVGSGAIKLAGPTSFAPAVRKSIELAKASGARELTICLIITSSESEARIATEAALKDASKLPIAIIVVGVGDGPFDDMARLDDEVGGRLFDNLNFVSLEEVKAECARTGESLEQELALACISEIPKVVAACERLRYIGRASKAKPDAPLLPSAPGLGSRHKKKDKPGPPAEPAEPEDGPSPASSSAPAPGLVLRTAKATPAAKPAQRNAMRDSPPTPPPPPDSDESDFEI